MIYAYDQLERLAIIERTIEPLLETAKTALDFGCGSGDFSRLLLGSGLNVWGYDPYVTPQINSTGFSYISSPNSIDGVPEEFDIILSITVLDHILGESELLHVLQLLRRKVSAGGTFILMEYALDSLNTHPHNDYQAFRQLSDWHKRFDASGWAMVSTLPVPNFPESPSSGYLAFRRNPWVKVLCRIASLGSVGAGLAQSLLRSQAVQVFRRQGPSDIERSPLKLIICNPVPEGGTPSQ